MIGEMVRRVTYAIEEKLFGGPLHGACPHCGHGKRDSVALPDVARAAIEAIREPTDAMLDCPSPKSRKAQWQSMIDEALK